jgi:hypothetical protein
MATAKKDTKVDETAGLPSETRLDTDVHAPATNAPGDAPADTTDPTEQATTITPQLPSEEALKAGTILGAIPVPAAVIAAQTTDGDDVRVEEYDEVTPTGEAVRVRHILDGPDAGKSFRV